MLHALYRLPPDTNRAFPWATAAPQSGGDRRGDGAVGRETAVSRCCPGDAWLDRAENLEQDCGTTVPSCIVGVALDLVGYALDLVD